MSPRPSMNPAERSMIISARVGVLLPLGTASLFFLILRFGGTDSDSQWPKYPLFLLLILHLLAAVSLVWASVLSVQSLTKKGHRRQGIISILMLLLTTIITLPVLVLLIAGVLMALNPGS